MKDSNNPDLFLPEDFPSNEINIMPTGGFEETEAKGFWVQEDGEEAFKVVWPRVKSKGDGFLHEGSSIIVFQDGRTKWNAEVQSPDSNDKWEQFIYLFDSARTGAFQNCL